MYRILLVDDEKIERNGMRFLLNQSKEELSIAEAPNGKVAWEYIQEHDVDILLTDVKMPFMDGMELIRRVVQLKSEIKIIIFSGHNEFEYAKEALKAGVYDYILKPVDPKEFKATIGRVIGELEADRQEQEQKEKSRLFLKRHLLYLLINGASKEDLENEASGILDTDFVEEYRRMILIEFNTDFFGKAEEEFAKDMEQSFLEGVEYLNLNPQQSVLFLAQDKDAGKLSEHLLFMVRNKYKEECHIAVSSHITDSGMIPKAMEELELLMENKFYQTDSNIYIAGMEAESPLLVQIDDDTLMKQMKQDIKMKDIQSLQQHFTRLCEKYRSKTDFSQVYIKFIFSNLLKDFYENLPDMDEKEFNLEIDRLYRSNDFGQVMDIINRNIERLGAAFSANPQMLHREIESVKHYIFEHYGEELSVEQLADLVYMAPSYLSCIFKKETGQNLSKFIKAYRMEKAKEMLETTHNKIVNISLLVGYPNVSYFCQSFREYFGVSPQKFRSQGEAQGEENP